MVRLWRKRNPCALCGNVKWYSRYEKTLGWFPQNYTFVPANPLLGKRYLHIYFHSSILFTRAQTWKPHKYPPTYTWISKMSYIHMKYYLAFKRKSILQYATSEMNLGDLILSHKKEIHHGPADVNYLD